MIGNNLKPTPRRLLRPLGRLGRLCLPLCWLTLIIACTPAITPAPQKIPDSLATCEEPAFPVTPAKATQADVAAALIGVYAAWEDCFNTVKRLAVLSAPPDGLWSPPVIR